MVILTRKKLAKLEDSYYWGGNRSWTPFPKELKKKLLEMYGEEPLPHTWTEQDIHEGARKIIKAYFEG
ncbi:hypothetical protein CD30_20000 [Ureibacillus massiliensis 4400831 = CIP 108448 = CCUG 49529]|uniref:Uncharacterized protein n=1 Tax=Ureibacillus massiliensis 4400831 = CIP 108448 = CCUG 49529 TaxID=1211035 RepID=A0A0A3I479_9BACL|nr:hypothetical protein [Ureibacillus massiliensis]KGR77478.1 hypothetical protein CD30_20000 [Ureibacillus massiliensis 4400831 = CIP 108448 = CCUG 49529]